MRGTKSKRIDPPERKEPIGGARRSRKYVKPEIITSSAEELLDELGTARACSFTGSVVSCPDPMQRQMSEEENTG